MLILYIYLIFAVVSRAATFGSGFQTDLFCHYFKKCQEVSSHGTFGIDESQWQISSEKQDTLEPKEMASNSGLHRLYRPRSSLARAFYEKQWNDRQLQEIDKSEWYKVDFAKLSPELQQKFVQLSADDETKDFLSRSIDKSTWVWTQIWYLMAKAVLKNFWSMTDINGWLRRGSMFVLSGAQAQSLLSRGDVTPSGQLVDIGAGDGEVSRRFTRLYSRKFATEISECMRKVLGSKGYTLLDVDYWWQGGEFDCVCMMNLLDRCSRPRSMLQQAKAALAHGGVLLLALVLPFKPYVEVNRDHKPEERLPIYGDSFEEQASSFVSFMSDEMGFELQTWSRAPYLCEGDFSQSYYWLDDSVYVFKPKITNS